MIGQHERDDGWLTPTEATKRLACRPHVNTLMRWILDGVAVPGRGERVRLAARKEGGRWRIHAGDLRRFVRCTTAATVERHAPAAPSVQADPHAARERRRAQRRHDQAMADLEAMGVKIR